MIKKHYKDMDFNIFHVSGTYSYSWFKEELEKEGEKGQPEMWEENRENMVS